MDGYFSQISLNRTLPADIFCQLDRSGFVVIPGPITAEGMPALQAAYDQAMDAGSAGPDFKMASATTRMYDFVNRGAAFDPLYVYPPLLEACKHIIGKPFKLSSLSGRTLRPETPAQDLHADISRDSEDLPLAGFILMIDEFRSDNGATRFVPESHKWPETPEEKLSNLTADYPGQRLGTGPAGSIVIFDASIWHGHTANETSIPRRSVQGYFVRREAKAGLDFPARMNCDTMSRISPLAKYLLAV